MFSGLPLHKIPSSTILMAVYYYMLCLYKWRRRWHPTPVLLPGKSYGWRSLVGCSPWGHEELDTTERLHFHFSLSCIGEGNGNPFQCSCLENPRDGGAWWAAIYGIAQSHTRLKRLSMHAFTHDRVVIYIITGISNISQTDIIHSICKEGFC